MASPVVSFMRLASSRGIMACMEQESGMGTPLTITPQMSSSPLTMPGFHITGVIEEMPSSDSSLS